MCALKFFGIASKAQETIKATVIGKAPKRKTI